MRGWWRSKTVLSDRWIHFKAACFVPASHTFRISYPTQARRPDTDFAIMPLRISIYSSSSGDVLEISENLISRVENRNPHSVHSLLRRYPISVGRPSITDVLPPHLSQLFPEFIAYPYPGGIDPKTVSSAGSHRESAGW